MKNNIHDKDCCFQFGLDILIKHLRQEYSAVRPVPPAVRYGVGLGGSNSNKSLSI